MKCGVVFVCDLDLYVEEGVVVGVCIVFLVFFYVFVVCDIELYDCGVWCNVVWIGDEYGVFGVEFCDVCVVVEVYFFGEIVKLLFEFISDSELFCVEFGYVFFFVGEFESVVYMLFVVLWGVELECDGVFFVEVMCVVECGGIVVFG